jgi:hypothetical protein
MKLIYIFLAIAILFFYLENNHSYTIEYQNSNPVRINKKNLSTNPFKELSRYIEDSNYYTPIWRICFIMSILIVILIYHYLKNQSNVKIDNLHLILLLSTIMFICYNLFNYKMRHHYSFINKSTRHILDKLGDNKLISKLSSKYLKNYRQITPLVVDI